MEIKKDLIKKSGDKIYLREPSFEELDYVKKLWADEKTMTEVGGPFELKDKEKFYKKMVCPSDGLNRYFLVFNEENLPIGEASFRKYSIDSKKAMLNIKIQWQYRGQGYGKDALNTLVNYFFNDYKGEALEDDIDIKNIRAQKIFLNYGFQYIPTHKEVFLVRLTKEKFLHINSGQIVFNDLEVENYLRKWQRILRLKDWDIKYTPVLKEWRKTGDIKIDRDDKKALLLLNNFNPKQNNLEELIVHELLHLKLWNMDQMIEGLVYDVFGNDEEDKKFNFAYGKFMETLESTVEDLTKAYMTVGGEEIETSFGRVEKQVEEEIK